MPLRNNSNLRRARASKLAVVKKKVTAASPVRVNTIERKAFLPGKYPGKIEITQGVYVLASLSFQLGERLKEKPVEVRRKDIYVDAGSLVALGVGTQYRQQGLATQLIHELIAVSKKQNAGNIYLRVNKHNAPAVSLYNKLGFKVVREMNSSEQLMAFYRV